MCVLKTYILISSAIPVQFENTHMTEETEPMPRVPLENNDRMSLRIAPEEKSLLVRAAALEHTNLTEFVVRTAVANAREIIEQSERLDLSERDSLQALALLENPPEPNEKLLAAAFAMPKAS